MSDSQAPRRRSTSTPRASKISSSSKSESEEIHRTPKARNRSSSSRGGKNGRSTSAGSRQKSPAAKGTAAWESKWEAMECDLDEAVSDGLHSSSLSLPRSDSPGGQGKVDHNSLGTSRCTEDEQEADTERSVQGLVDFLGRTDPSMLRTPRPGRSTGTPRHRVSVGHHDLHLEQNVLVISLCADLQRHVQSHKTTPHANHSSVMQPVRMKLHRITQPLLLPPRCSRTLKTPRCKVQ